MANSTRLWATTLLSLLLLTACGQKGPLFLPGDTNSIRTEVQARPQPAEAGEEDDEDETPVNIQN